MPDMFVKIVSLKGGVPKAGIFRGTAATGPSKPLGEYHADIQALLEGQPVEAKVQCAEVAAPTTENIRLAPGARLIYPGQAQPHPQHAVGGHAGGGGGHGGHHGGVHGGGHGGGHGSGHGGGNLQPSPFDGSNPYNFAEWEGEQPWPADNPSEATHEKWRAGRLSGVLGVSFTATMPIFVPAGSPEFPPDSPRPFWSCGLDAGGNPRYGLPGSTVKGAVRTHFEVWTNSHLGVVSSEHYTLPIPYRRRIVEAWMVEQERPDGSLSLRKCERLIFASREGAGNWRLREQEGNHGILVDWPNGWPTPAIKTHATVDFSSNAPQAVPYRANLYWVTGHRHPYNHLVFKLGTVTATVSVDCRRRYAENLEHASFRDHLDRVSSLDNANGNPGGGGGSRNFYRNVANESYDTAKRDLLDLSTGQVLFGVANTTGFVECLGKNPNFLWPSRFSPRELVHGFWRHDPMDLTASPRMGIGDADAAEATFGFIAPHDDRVGSHPFRGRVRFETFWAEGSPEPMAPVQLGALTSPTGVKLKARPLYLPPKSLSGEVSTYDDANRMRGRKLYWHQKTADGLVHPDHLGNPDAPGATQLPPPICPMPRGTSFKGAIHFDNLTRSELAALVVSVCPDLFWGGDGRYGIKIGKGKPRGLGSVASRLTGLQLRQDAYDTLQTPSLRNAEGEVAQLVVDYKKAIQGKDGFVRDLERLLRLPNQNVFRNYLTPQPPNHYGWMPGLDRADGEAGARPQAMKRARDISVP